MIGKSRLRRNRFEAAKPGSIHGGGGQVADATAVFGVRRPRRSPGSI